MTTVHHILEEFREAATSNRDLGDKFERLIATYLVTDPLYQDKYSDVWLWGEWPDRGNRPDVGIDLVAKERYTGDSQIANDPNDWSEDPRYIIDLLNNVIKVSMETMKIVKGLPALNEQV